ncbi:TPA: ATP phosphoribosyltransferase [Candidatus Bathyarchaeota archaeon]|nr:ATP phosphoribosyltransferase [Candidatus Bathyarchaeota archaeon]
MGKVRFAIPKGHLEAATFRILEQAGYSISGVDRTYRPAINDPDIELKILRPQEIPIFVSEGLQDVGITGVDWVRETGADVEILLDLEYSKVRLVLAVPKSWIEIKSLTDLIERFVAEGRNLRISTEYLNVTSDYIKNNTVYRRVFGESEPLIVTPWWRKGENDKVSIYLSFGATEAKPPEDADAIVDVVETGTSLERNNLKAVETIMKSTAVLIANKDSIKNPDRREKIYDIMTLLKGVVDGRKKIHIFVNVSKENLPELLKNLPALRKPTISPLSEEGWYSVNTVIDRDHFLQFLPVLRKLAQGLVVYEPRQVLLLERRRSKERVSTE